MIEPEFIDQLFLSYAAGSLSAAETLVMRALLEMNVEARRAVARMEAVAGRALEAATPADLCIGCLETVLSRIGGAPAPRPAPTASVIDALSACRPSPVPGRVARRALRPPGPAAAGQELALLSVAPGLRIAFAGVRLALVLEGSCGGGRFQPGDLVLGRGAPFALRADPAGAVLLIVAESGAGLRRALARLFGAWPC